MASRYSDMVSLDGSLDRSRSPPTQRRKINAVGRSHHPLRLRAPVADAQIHRPGRRQYQHCRAPPLRPTTCLLRRGRRIGRFCSRCQFLRRHRPGAQRLASITEHAGQLSSPSLAHQQKDGCCNYTRSVHSTPSFFSATNNQTTP